MSNSGTGSCSCGCGGPAGHKSADNLPGLAALRYRFGTHGSLKRNMLEALSANPVLQRFTSRKDEDFAIGLVDSWATVLDVLSFYQERAINEGYLRTATERFSVVELARHISYRLRPGVAAGGFLSFLLNEAIGAPPRTLVQMGTKVQSVPAQDELPQIFETSEAIEARTEWNAMRLQTRRRQLPAFGDTFLFLEGLATGLQPGDHILLVGDERAGNSGNEQWDFRKLVKVQSDPKNNRTRISWHRGLGIAPNGQHGKPAASNPRVFALRQKAPLFGYNAPDFRAMAESVKDSFNPDTTNTNNKNTEWLNFSIYGVSGADDIIHLDAAYPKILSGSWLVLTRDGYQELYNVVEAAESSRKDFTLSTKTTALTLSGENLGAKFDSYLRETTAYGQSEELQLAAMPVDDSIQDQVLIRLERLVADLVPGRYLALSGRRKRLQIAEGTKNAQFVVEADASATRVLQPGDSLVILRQPEAIGVGKFRWYLEDNAGHRGIAELKSADAEITRSFDSDRVVSEVRAIKEIVGGSDPTRILLEYPLKEVFDPHSVSVNANVAPATHGETKQETLGSGNGSAVFQRFVLKQRPLTYVSAATATGVATTLEIRVNDILWKEVATLYEAGPRDKAYTTSLADDGTVTVQFGDGINGARLPTGTENIRATYRVGTGTDGLMEAGQLSMLMTPQLGISKVGNPEATVGAADPERIERARTNAPLTVLTLDRIVSVQDFQDFARAFAGIGKSLAEVLWNGEQQIVHITIASEEGPLPPGSSVYDNLVSAIRAAAHPHINIRVSDYELLHFGIDARIQTDAAFISENVSAEVIRAIENYFSFPNRSFAQAVTPSEVISVIQGVPGVVYADLDLLDGHEPFGTPHFRLPALAARWSGSSILPAQLLLVDAGKITISAI